MSRDALKELESFLKTDWTTAICGVEIWATSLSNIEICLTMMSPRPTTSKIGVTAKSETLESAILAAIDKIQEPRR